MQGTITALEPGRRGRGRRVNVFLDERFAFSVAADVAATLKVGQQLGESSAAARILEQDQLQSGLDAALTFLGHRPRSEREIRDRLRRQEHPPTVIDRVVEKLRLMKLVDDAEFARYWVEQRQTFRPRGARLLKAELRQRGVPADVVAEVANEAGETEDDDAYRAARKKAQQLRTLDEQTFRQRLGQFLGRRGFGWEAITPAVNRLWIEVQGS